MSRTPRRRSRRGARSCDPFELRQGEKFATSEEWKANHAHARKTGARPLPPGAEMQEGIL